jgi:hypothetical protein
MKSDKEITEIFVAYDATESFRSAAQITGCDPKTVRRYVEAREEGRTLAVPSRERLTDGYLDRIEEWVTRSRGHVRADRVHKRLLRLGYTGSERTTRRRVAEAKARLAGGGAAGEQHRPWIPEPGRWLQFGWGKGPLVGCPDGRTRRTVLFCARLAWSQFWTVSPALDRRRPALAEGLDQALRLTGGAPTYLLTGFSPDTPECQHLMLDALGRHYGTQVRACVPHGPVTDDPRPGEGEPPGVRIAPQDWLPTGAELPPRFRSFAELSAACADLSEDANRRVRPGAGGEASAYERLAVERPWLHALPPGPFPGR